MSRYHQGAPWIHRYAQHPADRLIVYNHHCLNIGNIPRRFAVAFVNTRRTPPLSATVRCCCCCCAWYCSRSWCHLNIAATKPLVLISTLISQRWDERRWDNTCSTRIGCCTGWRIDLMRLVLELRMLRHQQTYEEWRVTYLQSSNAAVMICYQIVSFNFRQQYPAHSSLSTNVYGRCSEINR